MVIDIFKCVDCDYPHLEARDEATLFCERCKRLYVKVNGIYCMLPKRLDGLKSKEMIARDKESGEYDAERPDYTRLLDYFCIETKDIGRDAAALDIGCGTGRSTVKIARMAARVIAVDFSYESLRIAGEKAAREGLLNIVFIQADANKLPFNRPCYFDFINAMDFIQHIPAPDSRQQLISSLFFYLKRAGGMSISAYRYSKDKSIEDGILKDERARSEMGRSGYHADGIYYHNYTDEELRESVERAGFRIVEQRRFYFKMPVSVNRLRRIVGIGPVIFEAATYNFFKDSAWRIYIYASKG